MRQPQCFYKYQKQEQRVQPVACRDLEPSACCNQPAINTSFLSLHWITSVLTIAKRNKNTKRKLEHKQIHTNLITHITGRRSQCEVQLQTYAALRPIPQFSCCCKANCQVAAAFTVSSHLILITWPKSKSLRTPKRWVLLEASNHFLKNTWCGNRWCLAATSH